MVVSPFEVNAMNSKNKTNIPSLEQFPHRQSITTRWHDNDVYGHVNNVVYYSWFDTAVNNYLIDRGVLDFCSGSIVGLVVETQCNYFQPVTFPDLVVAGVSVAKIGNSSVRYEVGIFRNDESEASASGHFIHVYVDKQSRRPVPLPDDFRQALALIQHQAAR